MSDGEFTKVNLAADVDDIAGANGIEGLEAHFATDALGLQRSGVSLQRIEAGKRQPWGHRHEKQEEIYVIISGSGTAKIGDQEIEVARLDAIRVEPQLARNFEAGPDGLELLAFGAPRSPDDNAGSDSEMLPGWWGDEDA
jgi:mannose-6-phosphate isomerase-like protein (cupin superfamily)